MAVGDLVPGRRGGWVIEAPTHCRNGHLLGPNRVLVGSTACQCGTRHMTWWCRIEGCEATTYGPPLAEGCTPRAGIDSR
ncbi:hypothetical protein H7J86_24700 [Mycobacterium hackensackense]|uniref:hypothetical protein n=1 Tax=Mycobacterium hackensackense TaxID=228909 RepID=UPI002265E06C|nr:hypothetical protein [Mycobacterium hackensackense]MCV7255368.1 hypothetical protein [Mycobacterium hackensackense]